MPLEIEQFNPKKARVRRKSELLRKRRELQDAMLYLRSHRSPLAADEARLKLEAIRWMLCEIESL